MQKKEFFTEAIQAYMDYCDRNHFIFQQPSKGSSAVGRKYVHLRNVNGDLAKYNYKDHVIVGAE